MVTCGAPDQIAICSGLVTPETPQLGIKPEQGQILLPEHKSSHQVRQRSCPALAIIAPVS